MSGDLVIGVDVGSQGTCAQLIDQSGTLLAASYVAHVTPDTADAEIASRLDVSRGALVLTIFQVDETANGRPVLVSREHHLADAFEMTVYRRGPSSEHES